MKVRRASLALLVCLVATQLGSDASAHAKKFRTTVAIQTVVIGDPGGSVSGELSGSAKCLTGRTVTVTKNGNPLGTVTTVGNEFTLNNVTIASGDQLVATVAKQTIKRSAGHRHICLGGASPAFIPRQLEVSVTRFLNADDGNVTGPGIACPPGCTRAYHQGTAITLTSNVVDDEFITWAGACSSAGSNATCDLTINADTSVGAIYLDT